MMEIQRKKKKAFCDNFFCSTLTFIKCSLWRPHSFTYSLLSHLITFLLSAVKLHTDSVSCGCNVSYVRHSFSSCNKTSLWVSMLLFLFDMHARNVGLKRKEAIWGGRGAGADLWHMVMVLCLGYTSWLETKLCYYLLISSNETLKWKCKKNILFNMLSEPIL